MAINTFKIEVLESLKDNVEVLAQNLKFSQNMIENLIRDELRGAGVGVQLDRVAQIEQAKEVTPAQAAPVAQIEAPKEESKPEEVIEDPFIASIEAQAAQELSQMEEKKEEEKTEETKTEENLP